MNLQEKIIEILSPANSLKARDITRILVAQYGLKVDKNQINAILYNAMSGKVQQNALYEWSIIGKVKQEPVKKPSQEKFSTVLSKLANYYLECISRDMDQGISVFAKSNFKNDYTQLERFPLDKEIQHVESHLIEKVRKERNNFVFKVGYPVLTRIMIAKTGVSYLMAEPIFLFNVDTDEVLETGFVRIADEEPVINIRALSSILHISEEPDLLLELVALADELGINNALADKPDLEDILLRLRQIKGEWPWQEEPDFFNLSQQKLMSVNETGIFNISAVFVAEKSKFTAGLEKDLIDLSTIPESDYRNSALGSWISGQFTTVPLKEHVLIEPVAFNDEQREAIFTGLNAPLTVITGPPGTGKSQVVTGLIVNAVYQGQTVLFASKNNKAVDVVMERINALSSRQVMLRLGSKFQVTLSDYLSGLISFRPSSEDHLRYNEASNVHLQLLQHIETLKVKQATVIQKRNEVERIAQELEMLRKDVGDIFFAACEVLTNERLIEIEKTLSIAISTLSRADKQNQSFFIRFFWSWVKSKRFKEANAFMDQLIVQIPELPSKAPVADFDGQNMAVYEKYLNDLSGSYKAAQQIKYYFLKLRQLAEIEGLFSLSLQEVRTTTNIIVNSLELWSYWLQLMPERLSQADRRLAGDLLSVLNLIIGAESSNQRIEGFVWAKYYQLLPQLIHIISCWAVTSLSARSRVPLKAGYFDLVVIDEASQCDIASALPLLFRAKRAVIIGDDKQLTHISSLSKVQDNLLLQKYNLAQDFLKWGYSSVSLFRLASSLTTIEQIVVLREHHRSHAAIIQYSNGAFYDNILRIATRYENLVAIKGEAPIRWIDVKGKTIRLETGSSNNEAEANAIVRELERLISAGYKGTIGVVTPFRAQYQLIQNKVSQNNNLMAALSSCDFLCDTVHKFQGDERDLIIFSTVIGEGATVGSINFLKNTANLFNVAVTRARANLIIVGDKQSCYQSEIKHYRGFIDYLSRFDSTFQHNRIEIANSKKQISENKVADLFPLSQKLYDALLYAGFSVQVGYQVGQYKLDLAIIENERKLNIQIDTEGQQRNWDGEHLKKELLRNKRLIEQGWVVHRFWIPQVRDNLTQCVETIKKVWQKIPPTQRSILRE